MQSLAPLTEVRRAAPEHARGSVPPVGPRVRGGIVQGHDGDAVAHLAALSGRTPPRGIVLFAELAGDPVAAIGIFDGNVVADRTRFRLPLRLRLRAERLFVRAVIAVRGI